MNDDQVEIFPAAEDMQQVAAALLAAADELGERPESVETIHGDAGYGFRVPAQVADKAGYSDAAAGVAGGFEPSDHNVNEVNDYLADADDDERARVLAAEEHGKARAGVLEGPHAAGDSSD